MTTPDRENELRTCQQLFEASFHAAVIGKAIVTVTGHCVEVNRSLAAMLGYSKDELAGMHFSKFTHPEDIEADLDLFDAVMRGERDSYQLEKRYLRRDGGVLETLLTATCVRGADGKPVQFLSEILDFTERKQARRDLQEANTKLQQQVVTDHVTGLYNRRGFEEALAGLARDEDVSVLLIDLDDFKSVNDRLGHAAGDQVLLEVGRRLRRVVRSHDMVARLGGDEFGILLNGADCTRAAHIAERIVRKLGAAFLVAGQDTHVGVSVGVSCAHSEGIKERIGAADAALYDAKRAGRGQWRMAV